MAQNNQQNNNGQSNLHVVTEEEKAKIIADFLAQQQAQQMMVPQQAQMPHQPKVIDLKAGAQKAFMWIGIGAVAILTMGAGVAIVKAITEKNDSELANTVVIDDVTANN